MTLQSPPGNAAAEEEKRRVGRAKIDATIRLSDPFTGALPLF
jgi:hypothetical protein